MSKSRPYLVTDNVTGERKLVESGSQDGARSRVTKDRFTVFTPNTAEVASLLGTQGVKYVPLDGEAPQE